MLGLTEVRGIYLPPELHKTLRKLAKDAQRQAEAVQVVGDKLARVAPQPKR
jgi:hypothetical protein